MIGNRPNGRMEMDFPNTTNNLLDNSNMSKLNALGILDSALYRTCDNLDRTNLLYTVFSGVSSCFAFLSKNKIGGR